MIKDTFSELKCACRHVSAELDLVVFEECTDRVETRKSKKVWAFLKMDKASSSDLSLSISSSMSR